MLIGNKCDLSDRRDVTKELGQLYAETNAIKLFIETSVKYNIQVKEVSD